LGISIKRAAILLLPIALAACASGDDGRNTAFNDGGTAVQPFPDNYRPELLAFMRTYLNNPVGVHDAAMAAPVQRTLGRRLRYVSCLALRRGNPTAAMASRASAPLSMSMAGSTVSSRTPANPAPARPTRRFPNWRK
jgi:hypothetical protein